MQHGFVSSPASSAGTMTTAAPHSPQSRAGATAARPAKGRGSRGPRPRLFAKGACQADGCTADLTSLPFYNQVRVHLGVQVVG